MSMRPPTRRITAAVVPLLLLGALSARAAILNGHGFELVRSAALARGSIATLYSLPGGVASGDGHKLERLNSGPAGFGTAQNARGEVVLFGPPGLVDAEGPGTPASITDWMLYQN
jgi:hypothetical protein